MSGPAINDLILLRANLNRLVRVPSRIARRGAIALTNQVHTDTASGLDCYGKPFAPLAASTVAKGRRPPPMVATGASLDATVFKPMGGAGIAMFLGGAFKHHLRAYKTRPSRQVAPVRAGMPASWKRRIETEERREVLAACPELRGGA